MKSGLAVVVDRIRQFAAGMAGFSFDPTWGEIAGRSGLLLNALRETVLHAEAADAALLSDCAGLLEATTTQERINTYYLTVLRASNAAKEQYALGQAARIRSNAIALVRSAQLALGQAGMGAAGTPHHRVWADWLRLQKPLSVPMNVPIVGCCAGKGFLAEIRLTPIEADPVQALEHPEAALEPLGAQLMEAVAAQASSQGISFLWRIVIVDEIEGQLAPLDGDSLGAALAAGVELMSRRRSYHQGCLLIARVADGERLARTGFEREKLIRARTGSFIRVGVAPDSELSETDLLQAKPLIVSRLATVREAVEFAAARRPVPYL